MIFILDQIGGWGAELNREIVSCRACVRAVCMSSEFGVKLYGLLLSLFRCESLFPSPISYPASAGLTVVSVLYLLTGMSSAVPCQDLVDPCRALMIRAVPNISVPCRAKILVLSTTKKTESLRGGASQKLSEGARGAAGHFA